MRNRSKSIGFFIRRRHAFTLVEILVVIGIVGVLSAILFPAFRSARSSAQRATCASNLKQIGKALELYAQDHRGFYPPPVPYLGATGGLCIWAESIYPYLRSTAIFQCPAHSNAEFRTGCPVPDLDPKGSRFYRGSYAFVLLGQQTALHQARLRNPSGSVMVTGNNKKGQFYSIDPSALPINGPDDLTSQGIYARHGVGDNLLFAGSHVKWMSIEMMAQKGRDLWSPKGAF